MTTRRGRRAPVLLLLGLALLSCCAGLACGPRAEDATDQAPPPAGAWEAGDAQDDPVDAAGRFRKRRGADATASAAEQAEMERLAAIGYLEGTQAAHARTGVIRYDRERSAGGRNLYVSGHAPEAVLMDMEGHVLHRWYRASADVWSDPRYQERKGAHYFRRAYPMEDGSLLVIFEGLGLVKLDRDSNVIWASPSEDEFAPVAHHDVEIQPNGDLLALTRMPRIIPWLNPREHILDDFVTVYGPDGQEKQRISLAEAFGRSRYRQILMRNRRKKGDVFHTNSIHRLDGSVAHVNTAFDPGNVLVSIRHLSLLAVLDPQKKEIVWASRGPYELQHDAEVLPNGSLFLFDNGPKNRGRSRALELDPKTLEIRWEYAGSEEDPLWSRTCGTVQRLPGGNTLVVESDNGRAIEITPEGEIVWEWLSPHHPEDSPDLVATLFDLIRLPPDNQGN